MLGVTTRHAPGLVVMMTGELARYADTFADLAALRVPMGAGLTWFRGVLIADGLNKCLQALYSRPDLEWAWIMGDDHRFPPDVLLRLLDRDVDCVAPVCVHRHPPFNSTVMRVGEDTSRSLNVWELPTSGMYKLGEHEACGDAGLLIRKRVLDAIPQPWYDTRRSGAFSSDDAAFTYRVKEAGFDVYVDCETPIGHITPMTATPRVEDGKWVLRIDASDKPVAGLTGKWGGG